ALADDVPEDAGTAALLRGESTRSSGGGIAAVLRDNSELHDKEDAVAAASSHSAASPVQPLDSVFQSAASLPCGGGGHGLGGTISRLVASQLEDSSPRYSHRSESYRAGTAASGLDDDMLNTVSDIGGNADVPSTFAATAMGPRVPSMPERDAQYNDTFEDDEDEDEEAAVKKNFKLPKRKLRSKPIADEDEEAAVEKELQAAKAKIALQADRDALEEDEYLRRREIEDNQRFDGWLGKSAHSLSASYEVFNLQTSLMEDEAEARNDISMQQASNWGAIDGVISSELRAVFLSTLEDAICRWIVEESQTRETIVDDESRHVSALTGSMQLESSLQLMIKGESSKRNSYNDEYCISVEKLELREISDRQVAKSRQEWREVRSASLEVERERSHAGIEREEHPIFNHMQDTCKEALAILIEEQVAVTDIHRRERESHLEAERKEAARGFATSVSELLQNEQDLRKFMATEEWDGRRPLYDAHRKSLMTIRPRKPAVPRLSTKKIHVPAPPERPHHVTIGATWGTSDPAMGRPKILKVRPLALRRLPPYEEPTAVAPSAGRASATSVDEAVGRKAIVSREHHQWTSLISSFRHMVHTIDHTEATTEEVSLSRAYRHGQAPFRVSECEYDRYKELKDDAKRRRAHNEERFRLQSLVSRLIAVDMEFEVKLAMKSNKQRATAVKEPRPPFQYSSVGAAAAKRCAWEVIPRLAGGHAAHTPRTTNADGGGTTTTRCPQHSPQRSESRAPKQRPATAAAAQGDRPTARPPQAPRTIQSARPPPKSPMPPVVEGAAETFGECLDRKLEEALFGHDEEQSSMLPEEASPQRPRSPSADSSSSHRSSSSSHSSSSSASSISRRSSSSDSHHSSSTRRVAEGSSHPETAAPQHDAMDSTYADDSFNSTPASPDKSHNATTTSTAPPDASDDNIGDDNDADLPLPAREEVVHSLISHLTNNSASSTGGGSKPPTPVASSSKPPTPRATPPPPEDDSPQRNDSPASPASSSASSHGSWHPMESSGN
ncbi:Hypothetical protein, putative, partial [Bodo saltans]